MSGKKQREARSRERQREQEEAEIHGERDRVVLSGLPRDLHDVYKRIAREEDKPVSQVMREKLGDAVAKIPKGPAVKAHKEEITYNRIAFSTVTPDDLPLPIDSRNLWANRMIFWCIGGRFKHGTQIYGSGARGSKYMLLFDEPGQDECMYHFPHFDGPGLEHKATVRRFNEITRVFNALPVFSEHRRHSDYAEWQKLEDNLYNLSKPSVTTLLVKDLWMEFCYSMLRFHGHSTPNALVSKGLYDEKLKKHAMWIAPGSKTYVDAETDVLPYEIFKKKLAQES